MCLLTEEQLAIVVSDVKNEGINYSHLSTDLIDHVCCDVELHMDQGISFELAYERVKGEFGIKGLRRIQQDTLMLIDKNYRIMKSSMKLTGALALALMAFGALFKVMHWPMAALMLLISFAFTTFVFFPALLYVMYKEVNKKKQAAVYLFAFVSGAAFITSVLIKILHWPGGNLLFFAGLGIMAYVLIPLIIITRIKKLKINKSVFLIGLISLMIFLTGMIFKIMQWPGASILLTLGGALLVIGFIPLFYVVEVRKSEKPRVDFLFGIIALTYFIVLSFLLNFVNSQAALIDFNYQDKSYRQSAYYLAQQNANLLNSFDVMRAVQLSKQADKVYDEIEEVKLMIIQSSYEVNKEDAIILNKTNDPILHKTISVNYLLPQYNSEMPLSNLKKEIKSFNKLYSTLFADSLEKKLVANELLIIKKRSVSDAGKLSTWENYYFADRPPATALNTLSFLQYNIRLAENKALLALVTNPKSN